MTRRIDREAVLRGIEAYTCGRFEVRVLVPDGAMVGTFDAPGDVLGHLDALDALPYEGVYLTPNPLLPTAPRQRPWARGKAAGDADVARTAWLLLDVDPVRPKGVSATDVEKARAAEVRAACIAHLVGLGWPSPSVLADSGNGYHAAWRVGDGVTPQHLRRVLQRLGDACDTAGAKVDRGVFNASRIWKLPGTWARKGEDTAERPHRLARLESARPQPEVALAMVEAFAPAAEAPRPPPAPRHDAAAASFKEAQAAYCRDRTPKWPKSRGECPACGHKGCFGSADGLRWACWSTSHAGVGVQTADGRLYTGDALDLDAHAAGLTPAEHLRAEGYLGERTPRPELPAALDEGVDRYLARVAASKGPAPQGSAAAEERAVVPVITGDLRASVAPTLEALGKVPALYQRAGELVELGREPDGRMAIRAVAMGRLRLLCEDRCRYVQEVTLPAKTLEPGGKVTFEVKQRDVKVDDRVVQAVMASPAEWGPVRPIDGVIHVPALHEDASVCDGGYDAVTRLYVDAAGFGAPGTTLEEAQGALAALEDVLVDFPFETDVDRAVVLAMWITACVRQTMPTAPAFLVDSPSSGIGKTPLVNIASLLSTGRSASMTRAPQLEDELSKLLFAFCLAGEPVIAFDDVKGAFGGDVYDQLITSEAITSRVLGATQVARAPARALVMITGRNVTFRGDGVYRTLRARLVTEAERPDDERRRWRHPDLLGYVAANRVDLATACLTIVRAYLLAGRPCKMPPHKEFQRWNVVREALIWLGRPDVVVSVERQRDEADVDYSLYVSLCRAWHDALGDEPTTLSGIFDALAATGSTGIVAPEFSAAARRKALEGAVVDMIEMSRTDARAPRVLASRLKRNAGRPAGGYLLRRGREIRNGFAWQVVQLGGAGQGSASKADHRFFQ